MRTNACHVLNGHHSPTCYDKGKGRDLEQQCARKEGMSNVVADRKTGDESPKTPHEKVITSPWNRHFSSFCESSILHEVLIKVILVLAEIIVDLIFMVI